MKIASVTRSRSLRFAITPMIDVVFLLIIFFLVTAHFVKSETHATVELPVAHAANRLEESEANRLVITITADGNYSVMGRMVSWPELEAIILSHEQGKGTGQTEREIRIRGDQVVKYQLVKPILIASAQAKISKISFSVMRAGPE